MHPPPLLCHHFLLFVVVVVGLDYYVFREERSERLGCSTFRTRLLTKGSEQLRCNFAFYGEFRVPAPCFWSGTKSIHQVVVEGLP